MITKKYNSACLKPQSAKIYLVINITVPVDKLNICVGLLFNVQALV